MKYSIRKQFTFEAAHQLETAETAACHECIHGHSYTVELVIGAAVLDGHGMVLDFACLKPFKDEVMARWDHGLILHENKRHLYEPLIAVGALKKSKVSFLFANPTAESMARILFEQLERFLAGPFVGPSAKYVCVEKVRVHETSTGWAEYRGM